MNADLIGKLVGMYVSFSTCFISIYLPLHVWGWVGTPLSATSILYFVLIHLYAKKTRALREGSEA